MERVGPCNSERERERPWMARDSEKERGKRERARMSEKYRGIVRGRERDCVMARHSEKEREGARGAV